MTREITLPPNSAPDSEGAVAGGWWHDADDGRIVCDLCPRECRLKPGDRGFCFVRENRDGEMWLTTYGRSTGFCVDPIEKKPLNHFYPGTSVLSFGTAGCNLACKFCQNWSISKSREVRQLSQSATPETITNAAHQLACRSVAFTYNDPIIWAEYAIDTARECRAQGIKTVAVTAGYITESARSSFFEFIDAANVDLKAFTENFYQQLTLSHLQPVLDTIAWIHRESNVWMEITNLVIPRANDSDDEFRRMCEWILSSVGDEIPVHFTAFHPDFRLTDREATPIETLLRGYEIARRAGIKHAYVGNVNDVHHQSTYCGSCGGLLIERNWYELGQYQLNQNRCSHCGESLAGRFDSAPGTWGRKRLPVNIHQFTVPLEAAPGDRQTMAKPDIEDHGDVNCPTLTEDQQSATLTAVSELVQAAVLREAPTPSDSTLAGAANMPVFGCFVSIKRNSQLRGCCGFLGQRASLLDALKESAKNSATADARMPSVVADELRHLDFEIWLLFGRKMIKELGEQRINALEIGRHGLQIQCGEARGLLLPGVATDLGLDAESFLHHVCRKAGLSTDDWKRDDAQLATFEGTLVAGAFDDRVLRNTTTPPRLLTDDEVAQLATFFRDNVFALSRGAVPNYYLPTISDGTVNGVSVSLQISGTSDPIDQSRFSFLNSFPLQATVFQIAESIGNQLRTANVAPTSPDQIHVKLGILYEPAMHGTVEKPDVEGIDPTRRALLISQGTRSAWLFDETKTATELLSNCVDLAEVTVPESATVVSVLAHVNQTPFAVINVPRPQTGPSLRPPAVAGTFYPADETALTEMLDQLQPTGTVKREVWRAAMIPHAGLVYSGSIAADVLRRCQIPRQVIVIGPKHTPFGVDWAVAPHEKWSLPGITISSDAELADRLCGAIEGLQLDALAHQREHAIEVELPWIARFAPKAKVLGIAISNANWPMCHKFATGLAEVIRDALDDTLLIISTDMNHYANDEETRRVDQLAINALESLDPERVYHTVRDHDISMCGVLPACIVLDSLRQLGQLTCAQKVAYATSADASGDKSRVVGYAGMLFR